MHVWAYEIWFTIKVVINKLTMIKFLKFLDLINEIMSILSSENSFTAVFLSRKMEGVGWNF